MRPVELRQTCRTSHSCQGQASCAHTRRHGGVQNTATAPYQVGRAVRTRERYVANVAVELLFTKLRCRPDDAPEVVLQRLQFETPASKAAPTRLETGAHQPGSTSVDSQGVSLIE